ncbi:MAG: hypothetical protein LBT40_15630 [Deltaproteobacteria bacterium]|jgi:hypothetical protein|nr:hypothetical protein [Deltaproteobacteria bacterium]
MIRPSSLPRPWLAASLPLALALALASAPPLSAQGPPPFIYDDQPPVTQADVPAALEFLRAVGSGDPTPDDMHEIAVRHNLTDQRLAFIGTKFMTGILMLVPNGPSREDIIKNAGSPLAVPNAAELEIVRGVYDQVRNQPGN